MENSIVIMPLPYNGHNIAHNTARLRLMKQLRNASLLNLRNAPGSKKAPLLKLNNGTGIPASGFGTYDIKSTFNNIIQTVKDAIDIGYRHFDCVRSKETEIGIGQAIREKIEAGSIKREDVFLAGKLWSSYHRPELVELGCRQTLKNLDLHYLDLLTLDFPSAPSSCSIGNEPGNMTVANVDICDTWRAMEKLVRKGLVKSIGLSNFSSEQINYILTRCTIPPAVNQVEVHPYFTNQKLVEFCMARGIRVVANSPIPNSEHSFPEVPSMLQDPVLLEIAEKYNQTVVQVILRWVFQRGIVPLSKAIQVKDLRENLDVFGFHLSDEDLARIFDLNRNQKMPM